MRKITPFFITAFLIASSAALILAIAVLPNRLAFGGGESYTFYVGDTSKNCRVVNASAKDAPAVRLTLDNVCGESATFKQLDAEDYIKKIGGEVLFKEEMPDSVNYYCSAPLPYSVTLYGKQINLHVCVKAEGVTVASPIIFGGY